MTRDELKQALKPHVIKMQGLVDTEAYQQEHILPLATQWFKESTLSTTDLFATWNDVVLEIANEFTVH